MAAENSRETAKPRGGGFEKVEARIKLTPKQERFAQLVAGGLNQSDAYRVAYDAKRMKAAAVHVNASKLAASAKVALRVTAIRAPVIAEVR